MGRKTFTSIGRALPGRRSLVITRHPEALADQCAAPDCEAVASLEAALETARRAGENEVFVIGGGEIYTIALPLADRLYLTRVHARLPADAFFPPLNAEAWHITASVFHPADQRHLYAFTFITMQRAG